MRELGLRAWSIKKRKYLDIDTLYCANGKVCGVVCGGVVYDTEDVVLEQDTGLEDKNDKKIYEGDILAQTLIDDPFTKKYPTYVVCWDEKFLSWTLKDVSGDDGNDTDLHFFIEEWKKCEVIGNIHENKELLKGEK